MGSSAARMEEKLNSYITMIGKSEGRRPLGRNRRRRKNDIKVYFREIG
jgi:hypothetical protein